MKKAFIVAIFLAVAFLVIRSNFKIGDETERDASVCQNESLEITDNVKRGDTLFDIFKKYNLDLGELFKLKEACANIHRLRNLYPGRPYKIVIDSNNQLSSFTYWINDDSILNITRTDSGFNAEKIPVDYEKRVLHIGGLIKDNLIYSMGKGEQDVLLALRLSDVFAWDIDFTTDLRKDDTFKIVVEGFYLDGEFKKYGNVLSAEFLNNSEIYQAYRFEYNGDADYYDSNGKSLRRAFLKAPLNFSRISSGYTQNRFHPILKIYRPHLGVDYAAPAGTPVSAIGDGSVTFAGYKGQDGNQVIIKHPNGYTTYYGHLSRFGKGTKKGVKVKQGQIIGYVGATGLATGPHLDYRIKVNNRFVNPLTLKLPRGKPIPGKLMAEFEIFRDVMDNRLASITPQGFILAGESKSGDKI